MSELVNDIAKPCPFCGNEDIYAEEIKDPTAFWDGDMRGEECWVIMCSRCNANIKADTFQQTLKFWNRRAET